MKVFQVSFVIVSMAFRLAVAASFPNDLYYHHHPNEFPGAANKLQSYSYPGDRGQGEQEPNYRAAVNSPPAPQNLQPPSREAPRRKALNRNTLKEPVSKLKYNEDGSIDWSNKLADIDTGNGADTAYQNFRPPSKPLSVDGTSDAIENWMQASANTAPQNLAADAFSSENQNTDSDPYQNTKGDAHYGTQVGQPGSENSPDNNQQSNGQLSNIGGDTSKGNSPNDKIAASVKHEEPIMGFMNSVHLAGAAASPLRLATGAQDSYKRGMGSYYDLETLYGSCGLSVKNSDMVVAVNSKDMGDVKGKANPHCGKLMDVIGPSGKTIRVTVIGECRSCTPGGLDLSPEAFKELGDFSHGTIPVKWKYIN